MSAFEISLVVGSLCSLTDHISRTGWPIFIIPPTSQQDCRCSGGVGPLPFPDERFDIVFSKDSLIHVPDKSALYREVLRVLKPNGVFAASDWLRGDDAEDLDGYKEWRSLAVLDFRMQSPAETETEMRNAGLTDIRTNNRSDWYADIVAEEVALMHEDGWRESFIKAFGEEAYEKNLQFAPPMAALLHAGVCGPLT